MASSESDVRALLDRWSAAVRAKDLERLMSLYAPDIVYFDVVPPLRCVGADAVRRNYRRWFDAWRSGIGSEMRDLTIATGGDVAAAHMLHETSGILMDGREVRYWVRVTVCCRRSEQGLSITHEHVSLPVDFETGTAVMNLAP